MSIKSSSKRFTPYRISGSKWFDLPMLRKLYNLGGIGRGMEGKMTRYDLHPTLTFPTYSLLAGAVPVGKGGYGSPVVELAIRLLMAIVCHSISFEAISKELCQVVKDKQSLAISLHNLSDAIVEYDEDAVPPPELNQEARLIRDAVNEGCVLEFLKILNAARAAGLYARFQKNWDYVKFTRYDNKNSALFEVGTNLQFWIYPSEISKFLKCPVKLVKEKLDFGEYLTPKKVSRWVKNFNSLYSMQTNNLVS